MIAAYQRISRADGDLGKDGKDKSNSIENQKELIQRYISCKESLQNVPVMDFVDDGYTGSNFDRPGFQQMMDGVRNGKIDTIIVKDLSRFGRDYIGVGEYMEQIFPLLGVRLIAINDNYDSNNYKGTTLGMDVVVSNLVNTMYCRDAGKKLRTANQVKWRKGITTASAAPFGYQFDPDKKGAFIIDPPAAKIVRRIFDLAILGLGTREIAMIDDIFVRYLMQYEILLGQVTKEHTQKEVTDYIKKVYNPANKDRQIGFQPTRKLGRTYKEDDLTYNRNLLGHADIEKVVSEEKIRQLSRSIMDVLWFSLWNKAK